MVRRTILQQEVVIEEHVRLSREAIKKRVKLTKAIAAGINLGIAVLSAVILVAGCITAFSVMCSRTGAPGGELLVIPAIAFAFAWGHEIGESRVRRMLEMEDYEDGYIEQNAGR